MYGQHDAAWLSFYSFFADAMGLEAAARLRPLMRVAQSCGWVWMFAGACVMTDRPSVLRRDEAGRLHCEDGPALEYRDGFGVCVWHGYRLPETHEWIVRDRARLTPDAIDAEPNAELRRIMVEAMPGGFGAYIAARGAKLVSEDVSHGRPRRLFRAEVGGEVIDILHVVNGSLEPDGTRREFHLGAARDRRTRHRPKTPHEAVANSYGISPKVYGEACRT